MCPIDTVRIGTRCTKDAQGEPHLGVKQHDSRFRNQVTDFATKEGNVLVTAYILHACKKLSPRKVGSIQIRVNSN